LGRFPKDYTEQNKKSWKFIETPQTIQK
jgi:hypothetical protein